MFCNFCGSPVQQIDRFCNNCGHELPTFGQSETSPVGNDGVLSRVISASSRVRKQVLGVREKKYPFPIDAEGLINKLTLSFQSLGYSVSSVLLPSEQYDLRIPKQDSQDRIVSYVVEIKKFGTASALTGEDALAVRIRISKSSTLISLGITKRAAALRIVFLPTKGYNDQRDLSSKIWNFIDEYMKTFESEQLAGSDARAIPKIEIDSLFVGREREIEEFNKALESTIRRKPRHVAILGGAGIGKSTLLREFQEIASARQVLCVRREFDPSLASLQDIALFLVDSLDRESLRRLPKTSKLTDKVSRFVNDHGISMPTFFGFGGGGISAQRVSTAPSVLQEKTFDFLKKRAEKLIEQGVPGVVFLLDDADRLNQVAGAWAFLRTLFYRLNEDLGYFMVVLAGYSLFKRGGLEGQSVRRLFTTLQLGTYSKDETSLFLKQIFSSSPVKLSAKASETIYELSGGHPVILELFASEILENNSTHSELQDSDIQKIAPNVVSKLGEGFFWDRYQDTTPEERTLLQALSVSNEPMSFKNLELAIKNKQMDIRATLNTLIEKGLIVPKGEGLYSAFSPLFAQYVSMDSEISVVH
jgi:hypothetical protein